MRLVRAGDGIGRRSGYGRGRCSHGEQTSTPQALFAGEGTLTLNTGRPLLHHYGRDG
jgi:hypothetical protein